MDRKIAHLEQRITNLLHMIFVGRGTPEDTVVIINLERGIVL
jgi:hypothetical protein